MFFQTTGGLPNFKFHLWIFLGIKQASGSACFFLSRWWFQIFLFSSLPGEDSNFDDHIFQMGWNHQLVVLLTWPWLEAYILVGFSQRQGARFTDKQAAGCTTKIPGSEPAKELLAIAMLNNHGDRKSPKDRVVGPLPNGLYFYGWNRWGVIRITTVSDTWYLGAHPSGFEELTSYPPWNEQQVCTWKWMVGRLLVSFREATTYSDLGDYPWLSYRVIWGLSMAILSRFLLGQTGGLFSGVSTRWLRFRAW